MTKVEVDSLKELRREGQALEAEIASIEKNLRETGSMRSVEEVRRALEVVQSRMYVQEATFFRCGDLYFVKSGPGRSEAKPNHGTG